MSKRNLIVKPAFILCFLAVIVVLATIIIASAEEIHWESGGKTVLHKDENYTLDEYSVEVIDFDKDDGTVLLYFEKNGVFLSKFVLNATFDEYIYKDEIKINIYNTTDDILSNAPTIWDDPRIHIELSIKEKPCIYLAVDTDRTKYQPTDSEIRVTSKIINNGADIDDLTVSITPQELQVVGGISSDRVDILNNSSKIVTTRLRIPSLLWKQTFDIPVNLNWVDLNGVPQNLSRSTQITVLPICNLKVTKTVRDSSMESHVPVRIDVKNTGIVNLTIELSDHVPHDFELVGDCDLNWHFDIEPQEKKSYPYYLKAQKPGEFPTEPAIAQWSIQGEDFNVTSNTPSIIIDGACIIINKTAVPGEVDIGDNVTVTLLAINTGNAPATVYVADHIPAGTRLIDGNTTLRTTLGKNQSISTTYVIGMGSAGNITLPSPLVEIVNNAYSRVQVSEMFSINVSSPLSITTEPEPAVQHQTEAIPESRQPVFEIAFIILVTLLVGVMVWKIE